MKNQFKNAFYALTATVLTAPVAMAATPSNVDTLFAGADLAGVEGHVMTIGGIAIAIALVFKGVTLAKRGISKA